MATTSTKAIKLAADLADELRQRLGTTYSLIVEGFDANGFATISLSDGSAATTEDNIFICVRPRDWSLQKDIIGHDQPVYTPSVIQLAVEAPASGVGLARFVTIAHALTVLAACLKRGARTEYWEETNGTVPSITTFNTASKMKASNEPDLDYPLLSSQ
jgi:hypothetical protein